MVGGWVHIKLWNLISLFTYVLSYNCNLVMEINDISHGSFAVFICAGFGTPPWSLFSHSLCQSFASLLVQPKQCLFLQTLMCTSIMRTKLQAFGSALLWTVRTSNLGVFLLLLPADSLALPAECDLGCEGTVSVLTCGTSMLTSVVGSELLLS